MADRLFTPVKVGNVTLKQRIAMAPLTRVRASDQHVHTDLAREYYEQRASVPGTLLITEATFIAPRAGGLANAPGIYNEDQIQAWHAVTDAVHKKGSFIFLQLWALGRVATPEVLEKEGGYSIVSSSAMPEKSGQPEPHALTEDEIKEYVKDYAQAARNAVKAGFDGVEIHGANGYLIDQFWQDVVNQRTDQYGGSIENRARFGLEVTRAVVDAIGSEKTAIRLSPWSVFQGMRMKDPIPQFSYIVSELKKLNLAYLHLVESRWAGEEPVTKENDPFVELWGNGSPIVLAGGFNPENAKKAAGDTYPNADIIIAFGRTFISTPDLPFRVQKGIPLEDYDRDTFYLPKDPKGYIDYPFSEEWKSQESRL